MPHRILGISAYYHDSAAAIIEDGKIIAAAQEERFTRRKHDSGFPLQAVQFCLNQAKIQLENVDDIVFYEKPSLKFARLIKTYLRYAPKGFESFQRAIPEWLSSKLRIRRNILNGLSRIDENIKRRKPTIHLCAHHRSHAASAFYPSPFQEAAVLCVDGVGEFATTSVWVGKGDSLLPLWTIDFPHSLGLFYAAFTAYCGFRVNSGEYKLMGLAPFGKPVYAEKIRQNLIEVSDDGSFNLNMSYFGYATELRMVNEKFIALFGKSARSPESKLDVFHADIAASVQEVVEEVLIKLCKNIRSETGLDKLCMAGGVALNCVANGKILKENIFSEIWIQPAAGDAGGAIGCAMSHWYEFYNQSRVINEYQDGMSHALLGPAFSSNEIEASLLENNLNYVRLDEDQLFTQVAQHLAAGKVIGWFRGRMEFGPRALGGRSILGDPRHPKLQSEINRKIKFRESFRPFAPAVLESYVAEYFDIDQPSPYMLMVASVREKHRLHVEMKSSQEFDQIRKPRSCLPAVTHVDYSARIQTVQDNSDHPLSKLLSAFSDITGTPVLINTSFNIRGEPIVCSPADACRCFINTNMDFLVLENYVVSKVEQQDIPRNIAYIDSFPLD